jgi:acyl carrier protein
MTADVLRKVLLPKVMGAIVLHKLTLGRNIDFKIYFSSAASIWGGKGQAHYAAANIFLDTFAHYRHSLGLPALSINWGKFSKVSMISEEYHNWLSNIGMGDIELEESFEIMIKLLENNSIHTMVSRTDWKKFKRIFDAFGNGEIYELVDELSFQEKQYPIRSEEAAIESGNQNLQYYLRREVASTLGIELNELTDETPLNLLGLDSLMAVGLRNRINKTAGQEIHIVDFIDGSSIIEIVSKYSKNDSDSKSEIVIGEI